MRNIPNKIPASLLRQMDPVLALRLETQKIDFEAKTLEIQYRIKRSHKNVTIEVTMTESCIMRISPIRRGPNEVAEWGTYRISRTTRDQIDFTIEAHVLVVRKTESVTEVLASVTTKGSSLHELIRHALHRQYEVTGLKIIPLKKGMLA